MQEKGISSTLIEIFSVSGMTIRVGQFNFASSDITAQPNIYSIDPYSQESDLPDSVEEMNYQGGKGEIIIWYDEKCKKI